MQHFDRNFKFNQNELDILNFWKEHDVYGMLLEQNKEGAEFRFTDGPPFVNSDRLHHGHILVSDIKDSILRYFRMKGYNVLNKTGYDCHGLPIETEANKVLQISSTQEIEEFGIENYNRTCKQLIEKFSGSWEKIYDRIGRWMDHKDEYKTMDNDFMKSVWWVFSELYKRNLVYSGSRIMPFSTGCNTPLSNFEASQNYKDIECRSIYVKFPLVSEPNIFFIVWTTTPWTLPSNLALCVNSTIDYVKVLNKKNNECYILSKKSLTSIFNVPKKCKPENLPYTVLQEMKGCDLIGIEYTPMFDYFQPRKFRVCVDSYVDESSGTSIVHIAPAFGEEDYNVCIKNGIVDVEEVEFYCPVDDRGCYTDKVNDLQGKYVLDANNEIIETVRSKNRLVKEQKQMHNYPFCWRTDTPLIYKCTPCVFIKVTALKEDLIKNNEKINWIPENIGSGRFHQWLLNARDWCVSRNRYFGTPIPLWVSEDGTEYQCLTAPELEEITGKQFSDLHREHVDNITIPSKTGKGLLKRVPFVFDCWFESGAVPFGQYGYPYSNGNIYDHKEYLSDFICEGLDQTRGWFYTSLILSTALLNKPPFKNVICSGIVLSSTGVKMSKKYGNYSPLDDIIGKNGTDALRLYLLGSAAARGESFKFEDSDLEIITKKLYQLVNCFSFLVDELAQFQPDITIVGNNVMDQWITSRTSSLAKHIEEAVEQYEVRKVPVAILNYIEDLANWYLKFNRNRLKSKNICIDDRSAALSTLTNVFFTLSKVVAPFIPYLAETFYQKLLPLFQGYPISVHLNRYPDYSNLDEVVNRKVSYLQKVCNMVRYLREQTDNAKSVKVPINYLKVINNDTQCLEDIEQFESYLRDEINALNIKYVGENKMLEYVLKPNHKNIGQKFGKQSNSVKQLLSKLPFTLLRDFYEGKLQTLSIELAGEDIHLDKEYVDVSVTLKTDSNKDKKELVLLDSNTVVVMNYEYTDMVKELHLYRSLITAIQKQRKNVRYGEKQKKLNQWNTITIYYECSQMDDIILKYQDELKNYLGYPVKKLTEYQNEPVITEDILDVVNHKVLVKICDPTGNFVTTSH